MPEDQEQLSVSPTFYGLTPIGWMIVMSAVLLVISGATRVGLCELRASGSDQCVDAWQSLTSDLRTAGLGIGGLLAQSPLSALMTAMQRRRRPARRGMFRNPRR